MLVGYARVSTDDQDLSLQRAALKKAGCKRLYEEKISGAKRQRPELNRLLDQLRAGDVLVVSRLDRLARSTRDLLKLVETIRPAGGKFLSIAVSPLFQRHQPASGRLKVGQLHATFRGVRGSEWE